MIFGDSFLSLHIELVVIAMTTKIESFAKTARAYCSWCEAEPTTSVDDALSALKILPALYSAAIALPDLSGNEEAPRVSDEEWRRVFARFASLPFNYYASCFDPHQIPIEEKPVVSDAADDLADIWRDVKSGLTLFDAGHINAATWEWRFHFYGHWGRHLTSALYALHCWQAQNPDRLLPPISRRRA